MNHVWVQQETYKLDLKNFLMKTFNSWGLVFFINFDREVYIGKSFRKIIFCHLAINLRIGMILDWNICWSWKRTIDRLQAQAFSFWFTLNNNCKIQTPLLISIDSTTFSFFLLQLSRQRHSLYCTSWREIDLLNEAHKFFRN